MKKCIVTWLLGILAAVSLTGCANFGPKDAAAGEAQGLTTLQVAETVCWGTGESAAAGRELTQAQLQEVVSCLNQVEPRDISVGDEMAEGKAGVRLTMKDGSVWEVFLTGRSGKVGWTMRAPEFSGVLSSGELHRVLEELCGD